MVNIYSLPLSSFWTISHKDIVDLPSDYLILTIPATSMTSLLADLTNISLCQCGGVGVMNVGNSVPIKPLVTVSNFNNCKMQMVLGLATPKLHS